MDIATKHSCRNCRYYHKYKAMRYGFSCGTGTPKRYGETY